jgi:two-component sensor histidine kinase
LERWSPFGERVSDVLACKARPDVSIPRNEAQLVLAALYELATNAFKHGAFKDPDGRLDITWTIEPRSNLVQFDWKETLQSPVEISARRGFGRSLLEEALPSQLHTSTEFKLSPLGLRCLIKIPIASERSRSPILSASNTQ